MEKVFSFVFCAMLGAGTLWASDFRMDTVIAPGLTITANDSCYRISYKLPPFHEEIVETEHGYFSTIVFDDDDDFFEDGYDGRPALPVKSILLQLPEGTEEVGLHVIAEPDHYDEIVLSYPYLPAQNGLETDTVFQFDNLFYQSADWCGFAVDGVELSDIFHGLGTTGIAVNFTPITYFPHSNAVSVPSEISFDIIVHDLYTLRDLYGGYNYDIKLNDRFFDDQYFDPGYNNGRLSIFTLPEYVSALEEYVKYKKVHGYSVGVYANEAFNSPLELRNAIRNLFKERPFAYLLIVGDVSQIPYSKGVIDDPDNPPTDLYYACIKEANISDEKDCLPDVWLGRWPAKDTIEIKNMIYKSKMFESQISAYRNGNIKKQCSLLSCSDKDGGEVFFNNISVLGKHLKRIGHNVDLYDGRKILESEASVVVNNIMSKYNWILIYRGHGNSVGVSHPFRNILSNGHIVEINSSPMCPISFFFACSVGKSFGMNWVCEHKDKGGVASFAATTVSPRTYNNKFAEKIFNLMKKTDNIPYLGSLIYSGQKIFYDSSKNKIELKRQIERYMLIGDPSLTIYGIRGDGMPYRKVSEYEKSETDKCLPEFKVTCVIDNENVDVSFGNDVCADINIYNLSGTLVATRQHVCRWTQIDASDFIEGCYLVAVSVDGRIVAREKIFVKH